jgi:hypothetical protein
MGADGLGVAAVVLTLLLAAVVIRWLDGKGW